MSRCASWRYFYRLIESTCFIYDASDVRLSYNTATCIFYERRRTAFDDTSRASIRLTHTFHYYEHTPPMAFRLFCCF